MNDHFKNYVTLGENLARERNINWNPPMDVHGQIEKSERWDLTAIVGDTPPPVLRLSNLGEDKDALELLRELGHLVSIVDSGPNKLPLHWRNLLKSATLQQLLVNRNTVGYVYLSVIRPIRVLGTCANGLNPWELVPAVIEKACSVADRLQPCGALRDRILGVTKWLFDANHIAEFGQILPFVRFERREVRRQLAPSRRAADPVLQNLEERKAASKLPADRAFWELIRIVFCEQPKTFLDSVRFSLAKIHILTGLRVGEVVSIPVDWKREKHYLTKEGHPASQFGGIDRSIGLRHFAEKLSRTNEDSVTRVESVQYIPREFEAVLTEAIEYLALITEPLRNTLKRQTETRRILPHFDRNECISIAKLYPCLTGNPVLVHTPLSELERIYTEYRCKFHRGPLLLLQEQQEAAFAKGARLASGLQQYVNLIRPDVTLRDEFGAPLPHDLCRSDWRKICCRVDEVEDYYRTRMQTKISHTRPFRVEGGEVQIWELLSLIPQRAVSEGRGEGVTDIYRVASVARFDEVMMQAAYGGKSGRTLFEKYGQAQEDRLLSLKSHSIRHLQNTELFRLGVADTIISKRFNRRSVAQSHEYDHRDLSYQLEAMDVPSDVEWEYGSRTASVEVLINSKSIQGPIADAYNQIRDEAGADVARSYLHVEAGGFHSTAYGYCINSFTVNPCPKQLECFNGCRHFAPSALPEHIRNLETVRDDLLATLGSAGDSSSEIERNENLTASVTLKLRAIETTLVQVAKVPKEN